MHVCADCGYMVSDNLFKRIQNMMDTRFYGSPLTFFHKRLRNVFSEQQTYLYEKSVLIHIGI